MRGRVADWSAGALAVIVLALGGLVVVKPAVDHWDSLYRADPFEVGATTQRIEQRGGKPVKTTTTTDKASAAERVLGNSGLLLVRVMLVALAAFLASAVLHRAILGSYGLRVGRAGAPALAPSRPKADRKVRTDDSDRTAVGTRNGPGTAEEGSGASLAPSIAKLVASRREELGISQRELAKRAGISHTVISRIEQGEHTPSRKTLERLTDALRQRR